MDKCPECGSTDIESYESEYTKVYDGEVEKDLEKCNNCGAIFTEGGGTVITSGY